MNGIMKIIEPCHRSPLLLNKNFILDSKSSNLPLLQFDLAPDSIFMREMSEIGL